MQVAWQRLSSDYGHQIADILIFIYVYFTIPLQTAVVERGFGVHRIIKTRLRISQGSVQTIDSLLRVILPHHSGGILRLDWRWGCGS